MKWFTTEKIDTDTFVISEYRHPEETNCYLLIGSERCLLIDTGLGVGDIAAETARLTDKPIIAAATHIHWDHIGGHGSFPKFYAHEKELDWLNGGFPLPVSEVRKMLAEGELPDGFDLNEYSIFQGRPSKLLSNGDEIRLGGRSVTVIHTPGHSPGHMCFWEAERGYLFTGDLIYKGLLYANYPSTDPEAYLRSAERIARLPAKRIFPAHHSLDIRPVIVPALAAELEKLKQKGKLSHGSGRFDYPDWSVLL